MDAQYEEFKELLDSMANGMEAARSSLQSFKQKQGHNLDMTNGISLLSLRHQVFISYLRSLILVSVRKLLGDSLSARSPPSSPFSSLDRQRRGHGAGDLVDALIEGRLVLEKIEVLDNKMRYQIEKLVAIARVPTKKLDAIEDPLAFKPNPQALLRSEADNPEDGLQINEKAASDQEEKLYHPPRLAPMPYVESTKKQLRRQRPPIPHALANLTPDPSRPYEETVNGLGGAPAMASGRAKYLKRVQEYEEENFTRLVMKKSDANRRARDEEAIALGGDLGGGSKRRSRAGGLEDEFGDVLHSVGRVSRSGDGYDELRKKGKKLHLLERSRKKREFSETSDGGEGFGPKKRTRFEQETRAAQRQARR